jgi:hypothetical protein
MTELSELKVGDKVSRLVGDTYQFGTVGHVTKKLFHARFGGSIVKASRETGDAGRWNPKVIPWASEHVEYNAVSELRRGVQERICRLHYWCHRDVDRLNALKDALDRLGV